MQIIMQMIILPLVHRAVHFLQILNLGHAEKAAPGLRQATNQEGSRYMGRSADACSFGWPRYCNKAKYAWLARLQAPELIFNAELGGQKSMNAIAEEMEHCKPHSVPV